MEEMRSSSAICLALVLSLAGSAWSSQHFEDEFPLLMPKTHPARVDDYLCTPVRLAEDAPGYVVGFRPNSSHHIAHHMLVYGCAEPGGDADGEVFNCGEMHQDDEKGMAHTQPCRSKPQILYAWAKDAPKLDLPDGVGFRVGGDSDVKYLVLQVHYAALDHIPEDGDDSGVFLQFSRKPQPKLAGVLLLGTGGLAPPHSTTFFESACEIEDSRPLHPFAFRTHTHGLGKVVSGWRVKDRSDWALIGKRDPQRPQMFYPVQDGEMTIGKGDIVAARCTMVNTHDHTVYVGATNKDEMCNFYLMYWLDDPEGHGKTVTPNTCMTQGPPTWSWGGWEYGAALRNIPDEEASTL